MSTWGDKLQAIRDQRLNSLAETEFSSKIVYAACLERASLGFSWAEIRPSIPVNVQDCDAIKKLTKELSKEKVRLEWTPIRERPDTPYAALRISWDKPLK